MKELMVPLDGSPSGEAALGLAVALAQRGGGRIHLVHVAVPVPYEPVGVERFPVQAWSEKYLEGVAARIGADADVEVESTILDGNVVDALLAHARTVPADLVVMATHGRGPPSPFWLGSVTDRYLRAANEPVLVVRPAEDGAPEPDGGHLFKRIAVPLDGSEVSERALDVAIAVARLTDAELALVRAVERPVLPFVPEGVEVPWAEGPEVEGAQRHLDGVVERMTSTSVAFTTEVRSHEEPAWAILDFVSEWSADLVVMGTRGLGSVRRLFLGSVTDKVVRGARVPVLVVPRGQE